MPGNHGINGTVNELIRCAVGCREINSKMNSISATSMVANNQVHHTPSESWLDNASITNANSTLKTPKQRNMCAAKCAEKEIEIEITPLAKMIEHEMEMEDE